MSILPPASSRSAFPLAGIGGGTTPSFTLGLSYSSASVYETAINWNYERAPGEVGLGWSLPAAHMRIARLPGSTGVAYDNSFMLMTGTAGYRLALVGYDQPNNVKYYETNDGDFARLEFHDNSAGDPGTPESSSYWVLTDATGIKYYYGWAYRTGLALRARTPTSRASAPISKAGRSSRRRRTTASSARPSSTSAGAPGRASPTTP